MKLINDFKKKYQKTKKTSKVMFKGFERVVMTISTIVLTGTGLWLLLLSDIELNDVFRAVLAFSTAVYILVAGNLLGRVIKQLGE